MCNYGQHYRNGTPVCDSCKQEHADYARRWRRYGPAERDGLPEIVADYVSTNQPVGFSELSTLIRSDRPEINVESVRRVAYRLLDRGVLTRVGGRLVLNASEVGFGVLKCEVCGRPYASHRIGHCSELGGEPVYQDAVTKRTMRRHELRANA